MYLIRDEFSSRTGPTSRRSRARRAGLPLLLGLATTLVVLPAMGQSAGTRRLPSGTSVPIMAAYCDNASGVLVPCPSVGGSGGGGGAGGATGSVTAPGVSGSTAQAVQGITGGVPLTVSGTFLTETVFTTRTPTLGAKAASGSSPVVLAVDTVLPLPTGAATEAGLGTDGASPPAVAGTGARGWLRGIYERLTGLLTVDTVVRAVPTPRSIVIPVGAASAVVSAGGSGHAVGDLLTLAGGTCSVQPRLAVATVSSGATTSVTLNTAGSCTVLPSAPVATTSSGAGTGATLTPTYTSIATQIMAANAARRGFQIQPQGGLAYMSGLAAAAPDQTSLKLPADALYESLPQHVGTGAISVISAGSTPLPVFAREF